MNNFHHYAKSHLDSLCGGTLMNGVKVSDFKLLNQLDIGDKIIIKSDRWLTSTKHATIVGFKHPSSSYPVSIVYDDDNISMDWKPGFGFDKKYEVPLGWIHMNESVIRDIKINRIL